jgi:hypothetical protein
MPRITRDDDFALPPSHAPIPSLGERDWLHDSAWSYNRGDGPALSQSRRRSSLLARNQDSLEEYHALMLSCGCDPSSEEVAKVERTGGETKPNPLRPPTALKCSPTSDTSFSTSLRFTEHALDEK